MKLPYLKDLVFTRDNVLSLYRFSLMVKAGVSLEEALDTTYTDTRKGALKDDLSRALTNVKTGKPWADGFRTVHPTNKAALSMATDKERLGEILEEVADENKSIYIRRLEILRSGEHTSELQSLMRISYAVFFLKKKQKISH